MYRILFIILFIVSINSVFSQDRNLIIKKAIYAINLDGQLNEASWINAEAAKDFYQRYPIDTGFSISKTVVKMTFDENNLYVAAICYDNRMNEDFVVTSLQRDFSFPVSDAFAIFFDPFNDKTNGFSFSVNPYGVQREGLIESAGTYGVSTAWDNKWFVEVEHFKEGWTVEMKIPFKSIRYKKDLNSWGINFSRNNLKINENSVWNKVPINFNVATLNFAGTLNWDESLPDAGPNVAVIPYSIAGFHSDYIANTSKNELDVGLDAKIAISSSLNLDLTINPDFSNVDVDQQVTNLSRFSLFFPERRQFFIENSDLFGRFGFRNIRPFFSRRIGLYNGTKVPIIGGARLSGKINENWRIGLMNIQTEGSSDLSLEAQNYSVAAFQRQIGESSNLSAIIVNQQGFDRNKIDLSSFNRIVGLDYNLSSSDGKWRGKLFYHHSFSPDKSDYSHASWLMYKTRKLQIHWNHEYVGDNFRAETGFVPRIQNYNAETQQYVYNAYWRVEPSLEFNIYPNGNFINRHSFLFSYDEYFNVDFSSNERTFSNRYVMRLTNQSEFRFVAKQQKIFLPFVTDVTFSDNTPLDTGYYSFSSISFKYKSSPINTLNFDFFTNYGQYYTGNKLTYGGNISYRIQPYGRMSIDFEQNNIWMPNNENVKLTLISPRFDLTFTKKIFFTTFIQYNTQINNVNINARFQYRFKPMSDVYLVYTDNYNSNIFGIKNRALVIKLIYWLNI
ncbi:MAG: DUF5916 domain-containing protein [Flavobacteriales bacterium]|nr:DUF5916 domain-containing protein [Flavobacteriales bacterium]